MGTYHEVAQGEYLSKIARHFGFSDYRTIWDAPENKELKDKRKNPNILFPGDRLFIPDRETKEESRATEKRHTFKVQGQKLMVRIALHGLRDRPLSGHETTFTVETDSKDLTTQADGIVEREIAPDADNGRLIDHGPPPQPNQVRIDREIPFRIGRLDPVKEVSGQIARLNNLGYNAGDIPDRPFTDKEADDIRASTRFKSAVEEFQCDFKVQVDGKCGPNTQAKLKEVHGC